MIVKVCESVAPSSGSSLFTRVISASVTRSDFELNNNGFQDGKEPVVKD